MGVRRDDKTSPSYTINRIHPIIHPIIFTRSTVTDRSGPEVIKLFMPNSAEHEISLLINMKMPTKEISMFSKKEIAMFSNLIFISKTNFMLSWVEHEKSFITPGPDQCRPRSNWSVQADLILLWAHMSEGKFPDVVASVWQDTWCICIMQHDMQLQVEACMTWLNALKGLDTPGTFSALFPKVHHFCDCLLPCTSNPFRKGVNSKSLPLGANSFLWE